MLQPTNGRRPLPVPKNRVFAEGNHAVVQPGGRTGLHVLPQAGQDIRGGEVGVLRSGGRTGSTKHCASHWSTSIAPLRGGSEALAPVGASRPDAKHHSRDVYNDTKHGYEYIVIRSHLLVDIQS